MVPPFSSLDGTARPSCRTRARFGWSTAAETAPGLRKKPPPIRISTGFCGKTVRPSSKDLVKNQKCTPVQPRCRLCRGPGAHEPLLSPVLGSGYLRKLSGSVAENQACQTSIASPPLFFEAARVLQPGGRLIFVTDDEPYSGQFLNVASRSDRISLRHPLP